MPVVLLLLTGALAAPPPLALPSGLEADVVATPGELQLWVTGDRPGLVRVTRTSDRVEGTEPACSGGGADVFAPDHADAPWLASLCAGLEASPPTIPPGPRLPPGEEETARPRLTVTAQGVLVHPALLDAEGRLREALWPWRPLHALVLVWLGVLAASLPRRREPWRLALAALAVRLALTPDRALMAADAPFERYVTATGLAADPSPYGGTWAAMLGPGWLALGDAQALAHLAALLSSALSVALVWELSRRWFDERAARAAGLLLLATPLAVALARTEDSLPLAGLLQVTAMLGLSRRDPAGGVLAAASAVLLASLRPTQIPFAGLTLGALALDRASRPVALVAALMVAGEAAQAITRALDGVGLAGGMHLEALPHLLERGYVVGPGGRLAPSDPSVTPIGVTALAITSLLWVPGPYRRSMALAWGALAVGTLPWLHLPDPAEAARAQLPAQTWVVVLAGAAWACIDDRARRPWLAALALSWVLAREPLHGARYPWTVEHDALRHALRHISSDEVVRFRPANPGSPWQQRYYQLLRTGVWVELANRPLTAGEYRWLGLADAGAEPDPCRLTPVWETMAPLPDGSGDVAIGLYEVVTCDPAERVDAVLVPKDGATQSLVPGAP